MYKTIFQYREFYALVGYNMEFMALQKRVYTYISCLCLPL